MNALSLLFSNTLKKDRLRLGCAGFGVAAAAALLTWTLGLAVTTWWQGRPLSETMGKPFDCWVATNRASGAAPKGTGYQNLTHASPIKMIPQAVAEAVLASPDIESCLTTTVFRCRLDWRPEGRPQQGPGAGGGISPVRDFLQCPYPDGLAAGRWPTADAAEPEFVISPFAFGPEGLKAAPPIGTRLPVVTPGGTMEATLCGYLAETIRPVSGFPTMFASDTLADAAALANTEDQCNLMLIRLKPFRSPDALAQMVRTISPDDDSARLITRADLLRQLRSDAIQSLSRQVPLLVILACVATLCMIVNALCAGIEQNRLRYARLRALVPEARIGVAHGQMKEHGLEDVMMDFYGGSYDVLLCTTIIESGLDVPTANTLIVFDADRFGLSQLHQLRGRVGRSTRHAYAYFTYRPDKNLTEIAEKRLSAIRDFAEFGSGFKIAMRDLEIRGAGNLLGSEQSGHMMSVGYDMYLKLLDEAVLEQKGEKPKEPDCTADLNVTANVDKNYVERGEERMDLYRRMAAIRTQEDADDLLDEIVDRYGEPPRGVLNLVDVALVRAKAKECAITDIRQKASEVWFTLAQLNMEAVSKICSDADYQKRLQFVASAKVPTLRLKLVPKLDPLKQCKIFVEKYRGYCS